MANTNGDNVSNNVWKKPSVSRSDLTKNSTTFTSSGKKTLNIQLSVPKSQVKK